MREHHILITGASGFVGAALTERLLDEGAQVTTILAMWEPHSYFVTSGLIHQTTNVIGSIGDYDTVQRTITAHQIDTVIHLAAIAVDMNWSRLIPGTIRRVYMGESPVLRMHPHGSFRRDFL